MKIGIYGGGAWGTALASILAKKSPVFILRDKKVVGEINKYKTNKKFCGSLALPQSLHASDDLGLLKTCDIVLVVVPAQSFKNVCGSLAGVMKSQAKIILCSKGIDRHRNMFLSEVAGEYFTKESIAILSGPSFSVDALCGKPCAVSLAACNLSVAKGLANNLSTQTFRIYANDDVRGVESGGALKNIYAIAVGIARGLGLGKSSEAALLARSFNEMQNLVVAFGGRRETVVGLSGLGDLILTASSTQSRNFSYGVSIGRGEQPSNKLAEGIFTCEIARKKAREKNISTPIIDALHDVLTKKQTPQSATKTLLSRPLSAEFYLNLWK